MSETTTGPADELTSPVVPYPAEVIRRYTESGLWGELPIGSELHATAKRHPDREALVAGETRLTYAELDRETDLLAAALQQIGFERGDRIIFQLDNRAETVLALYGAIKAGLVPVCTLSIHRHHEIDQIASQTSARGHLVLADDARFDFLAFANEVAERVESMELLLTVGASADAPGTRIEDLRAGDAEAARAAVEATAAEIGPADVAILQLSGGTTAVPKVIPRLHAEYWYNGRAYAEFLGLDEQSRVAHIVPVVHNAGIAGAVFPAHSVGASLTLSTPKPEDFIPLIGREQITCLMIGLPMARALLAAPELPEVVASIERLVHAGGRLPLPVATGLEEAGFEVLQLFGTGEGIFIGTPPGGLLELRHETVGVPISSEDEVKVLEPGGEEEVAPGEEGELCCRGPYTIRGYYNAADHNTVAFTSDGFYRTGDIARLQTIEGIDCYSIEGRLKDLINRGSEKVNAEELEALLIRLEGVQAVAVVGMPDPNFGERTCAFVVAEPGHPRLDLDQVKTSLEQAGVAKYKWPERLEWLDSLPTVGAAVKVDKKALRATIAATLEREAAARGPA
jgi:non-ribosomal peptide synthetase component E (peptide arylation enzyme)